MIYYLSLLFSYTNASYFKVTQVFLTFLLLWCCVQQCLSVSTNLLTGQPLDKIWFENGFVALNSYEWKPVNTLTNNFANPLVFMSLPSIEGNTYQDGYPTSIRLKDVAMNSGSVSFSAKVTDSNMCCITACLFVCLFTN